MALSRGRPEDLPADAVIIDAEQALSYEWKIISKWESASEVWALRHGSSLLASLALGASVYVNSHFRGKLNLGSYGRFSTYLPIIVMPALFSLASHKLLVQRDIILRPFELCSTCLQLRAAFLQMGFGVVYPTLLAPLAACMFATRHYTYRLPTITEKPLDVLKLMLRFGKPVAMPLAVMAVGQALLSVYLTYRQQQEHWALIGKMRAFEREIEEKLQL